MKSKCLIKFVFKADNSSNRLILRTHKDPGISLCVCVFLSEADRTKYDNPANH